MSQEETKKGLNPFPSGFFLSQKLTISQSKIEKVTNLNMTGSPLFLIQMRRKNSVRFKLFLSDFSINFQFPAHLIQLCIIQKNGLQAAQILPSDLPSFLPVIISLLTVISSSCLLNSPNSRIFPRLTKPENLLSCNFLDSSNARQQIPCKDNQCTETKIN